MPYRTYVEEQLQRWFTEEEKKDVALIEALKQRMGTGAALYVGATTALWKGQKHKLDPENYHRALIDRFGDLLLPSAFATAFFGQTLPEQEEGYTNLTAFCRTSDRYLLFYDSTSGLAFLSESGQPTFAGDASDGVHTNAEYRDRMIKFFTSEDFPEPQKNNAEQSRKTVTQIAYEGPFEDWTKATYHVLSSPSIMTRTEGGKEVIYVSHEHGECCCFYEPSTVTYLKRSEDDGKTWETVGSLPSMRWATVFAHKGEIYLLGNHNRDDDHAWLAHLLPDGTFETVKIGENTGPGNPCPMLFAKGRIYKAMNNRAISIDQDANLMDPTCWTVSENTTSSLLNADWKARVGITAERFYYEEINVVEAPDGGIMAVMRTNNIGVNKIILLRLSDDGKTWSYLPDHDGLVSMPTTRSRFTCRRDPKSGRYVALTSVPNTVTCDHMNRTVSAVVVSDDLKHWELKDYLIIERDLMNARHAAAMHGFQYIDFVFAEEDILFVIRESRGESNMWHDGNHISYYRLKNYPDVIA